MMISYSVFIYIYIFTIRLKNKKGIQLKYRPTFVAHIKNLLLFYVMNYVGDELKNYFLLFYKLL